MVDSNLHHPQSVAPIGDTSVTYTLDAIGVRVQHSTTWLTDLVTTNAAGSYPAMMTGARGYSAALNYLSYDRGSGSAHGYDVPLILGNEANRSVGQSDTMWIWVPGGRHVNVARMANAAETLLNWQHAPIGSFLADRRYIAKAYWPIQYDGGAGPGITQGDIWAADTTYRWATVTDADAICSRGIAP